MVTDGKAGHLNQMRGLVHALGARAQVASHRIDAPGPWSCAWGWLLARFARGAGLPDPDLILCAGRSTHLAALAARRARRGRVVVCMRPSLPTRWFDLCLIPRHDLVGRSAPTNVVETLGALCDVRPSDAHDPERGVFLIGGPSKRHQWDEEAIVSQVHAIVERSGPVRWRLTTSRRTPATTTARIESMADERLEVIPADQTAPGWVHEALATAGTAWVTEDSVSMLYEALTSGCAVGALRVARTREDRVSRGIDRLAADRIITPFDAWRRDIPVSAPATPIDESARCAGLILAQWFEASGGAPVSSPPR
ncbi:MAG: mitochondrial fission ELM1 family protein [Phycisphaerales bacterium]